MKKVVIVDDDLSRAISIANQLEDIAQKYDDIDLAVDCIFYWVKSFVMEKQLKEIENTDIDIEIKPITLYDFFESLDKYYDNKDESYVFIMRWSLEGDYSRDIPSRKVNVRYFRSKSDPNNIWFYTGAGWYIPDLVQEVTNGHLIKMKHPSSADRKIELELEENWDFMYELRRKDNYKVKSRTHR